MIKEIRKIKLQKKKNRIEIVELLRNRKLLKSMKLSTVKPNDFPLITPIRTIINDFMLEWCWSLNHICKSALLKT